VVSKVSKTSRTDRLAAALRANLKRRKAKERAKDTVPKAGKPKDGNLPR
jgi:hypothetical protein